MRAKAWNVANTLGCRGGSDPCTENSCSTPGVGRLKEYLRKSLYDCGWHDELKAHCKGAYECGRCGLRDLTTMDLSQLVEVIKTKGVEKIEVEDLVREITPHGRGALGIQLLPAARQSCHCRVGSTCYLHLALHVV